ncbi:unnamed protein product [Vitrella brassicaformis CCMP3155]|uniref:HTH cro/C1-type domain-containing protein n=2 Tax=Vitrella brassicaformis TaxID=1169539 RepID=A0A0G4EAX2_VITBC|nr:unnamed protein product [Vitrella brassicaformis CCMP3155]|mmetsp:Transcript_24441/g.60353  ORF Transcript_24441/g.60353 Transcript_24441/m.60353 type:complete len:145 (+) Transcript_24441:85-519(+)|eukprot:CEL92813.1 unnamed protein product [Vitrella brassicaformis CCMP3155]
MSRPAQGHQDWETVTWSKTKPSGSKASDAKVVNQARRAGDEVDTVKKFMGGQNRAHAHQPVSNAKKLEEETENFKHDRVSHDFAKALQQARLDKKLTQAELAQRINEKASVINEYEAGKAIPNPQILSKLRRVVGNLPAAKATK